MFTSKFLNSTNLYNDAVIIAYYKVLKDKNDDFVCYEVIVKHKENRYTFMLKNIFELRYVYNIIDKISEQKIEISLSKDMKPIKIEDEFVRLLCISLREYMV